MGTRAVLIFTDIEGDEFAVYKHWDGNPRNIARLLDEARLYAWPVPRFEADEFAAAFVAAAKKGEGDVRLMHDANADVGQQYTYTVTATLNKQGGLYLNVMVYGGLRGELPIFCGATGGFREWAATSQEAA